MRDDPRVYVIATIVDGLPSLPVKIGISNNPQKRFESIKTSNPSELKLMHVFGPMTPDVTRLIERATHDYLTDYRMSGEWFSLEPSEAIEAIRQTIIGLCEHNANDSDQLFDWLNMMGAYSAIKVDA